MKERALLVIHFSLAYFFTKIEENKNKIRIREKRCKTQKS
jgi:hypothetical protein